jgi:hypothetical protein
MVKQPGQCGDWRFQGRRSCQGPSPNSWRGRQPCLPTDSGEEPFIQRFLLDIPHFLILSIYWPFDIVAEEPKFQIKNGFNSKFEI